MGFQVAFPLPAGSAGAAEFFPPLVTWLRLNPQWSLLDAPETTTEGLLLHLRDEQCDEEIRPRARFTAAPERGEWQLRLELGAHSHSFTVRLIPGAEGSSLSLIAEGVADDDHATRTNLALWQRSTHDYMLLSMRRSPGARLTKWFLDRVWLPMSQPGRRLVFLVVAMELAALALFVLWLVWTLLFG